MLYREKVVLGLDGGDVDHRANIAPLTSEEMAERGREPSSVAYRVALPPLVSGGDLTAQSTITWRGVVYQVLGKPMQYTIGGRLHHIEVIAIHATG